ncbi:LacI family transcriptional regulator [Mucilaginibacter gracilis]|uniref:LacI family transcriptional regulator n=1 Tax=Mucilaginibacter gracilis TaxID=423350 RepID=A0A495IXR1_9SPHI|nr:LacI family DNA-binding transcriptional regulator [Mucilaginibacter gracilis]RKR81480.1 LacI family transcriptional regulator [Mucilaginibacter gracilis]
MFEPITIKDIAKALGLSTSTVSRALRGGYEISAETKKLVLEYAEKINYHPNPIALSLKERRSHSIGVVVCEVANNYFSQAINGIESIAYNRGYHVIITQTHESYDREVVNVQHMASRSVDGLLVSLSSETQDLSHLKYLHDKGLPIVFFDRVAAEIETHKVVANNYKGAFDATEHLIQSGIRKIGHLTSSWYLSITIERLEGYKAALAKHNIPFNADYLQHCDHGGMIQDEVENAVKHLINLPDKPEAIFVAGDRLSTGCLIALKKLGVKVPLDIAIAGFTNSDFAELFSPPLTTVRQPAFKIGQIATEMLIQLIESKYPVTEFETKMLDTELFIRESSEFGVPIVQ